MRLLFIAFTLSFVLSCPAQSKIDVLHYKYSIELNDKNDTIYGKATIFFKAVTLTEFLELDLTKSGQDKNGMQIVDLDTPEPSDIGLTAFSAVTILSYRHQNDKLKIGLSKRLSAGESDTIVIKYKGVPDDGLIISKNKYGNRTFFSDNWPNRAHHWIPCIDDPADKASVEFIITAPSHYQVVSNGTIAEETNLPGNKKLTHWKEEVPLPTKVMVIGVADFAVNKAGEINCIPVYSWVYPENKKEGFYDYALAKDILSFFIDYFGPYPYKKLANVQSKTIFGGMENAGAIFYHENSVDGRRTEEGLFAHEIVHQWFGDMATEKNFAHLWLSEGFATYFTHVYYESKYGGTIFANRMQDDRQAIIDFARSSGRPVVDSITDYMQLLNTNSYQRGGWVLHMLRRESGDSIFHQAIRAYYEFYKGKNATTEDLQAVFEKVSGKNLGIFFRQWLYRPEIPKLNISWKYNVKEKNISVTVTQLQAGDPFRFPLDIKIQEMPADARIVTMTISQTAQTFTFPVSAKPLKLMADPHVSLLFEGVVTESK